MKAVEAMVQRQWEAALHLAFQRRGGRCVLARKSSLGPLAVQKPLYPEGDAICHAIVLHPPGGIAGGDRLAISIAVEAQAHALLTTPGATKWYRSNGVEASQCIDISVGAHAVCEWLPQENIFFASARAQNGLSVDLAKGAIFCGWDVVCLGRTASGERFDTGRLHQHLRVTRGAKALFEELGLLEGGAALQDSPVGLAGYPVYATFILAGAAIDRGMLEACRAIAPEGDCKWGMSAMGEVLVMRGLSRSAEALREYFVKLWERLRPGYAQASARRPRIWAT
jgi:urease accessory protein